MFFFRRKAGRSRWPLPRPTARPSVEALESRLVPYGLTGNAWSHPQLVTISFVPDGTVLAQGSGGYITSNLFATLDGIPGITSPAQWQNIILKAAQSWAAQTNINFAVVPDNGAPEGSGGYQQGASTFGDIRIGGYNFGSSCNWLASTYYPPSANNYSIAGDVAFNTGYNFNIGSTYDLFTVAEHEIGHALGLACSGTTGSVMYGTYSGVVAGLSSDDIAGIRSIYSGGSARSGDGAGNSFSNAQNITSAINPTSLTAVVNNLTISSTVNNQDTVGSADVDFFKFTAPAGCAGTMTITVQSAGLSLLSPLMTVYAANQTTVLGTVSGKGQYGTTLTLTLSVTAGATYFVKVQGADTSVFSTGAYALTLNLGYGLNPTVAPPNTLVANGNLLSAGGGVPMEPANAPTAGVALYSSAAQMNFNGTAIPGGDTLWFSNVCQVSGLPSTTAVTLYVSAESVNCMNYSLIVPGAVITFSPTATTATTTFNAAGNDWVTVVPSGLGGNVFVSGFALPVPSGGMPGGIQDVSWQAQFTSGTAGVKVSWKWGAAAYTSFGPTYTALNVKPVESNQASEYQNSDHAGTPEAFKSFVTAGATGGGGNNYTGNLSGTASLTAPVVASTASLSGSVINAQTGAGVAGVTITLTGTTLWGQSVTLTATTDANGNFSFSGVPPGVYSLSERVASGYQCLSDMLGSVGGSSVANSFANVNLLAGVSAYGYGFAEQIVPG
jgi:hypothetical protein